MCFLNPDHLSRPAELWLTLAQATQATQQLDMIDSAVMLQDHKNTIPEFPANENVDLPNTHVQAHFYEQDAEEATIVQPLLAPSTAASSDFRHLFVVCDGAAEGQLSIVIPFGPLRAAVCMLFHEGAGYPGVQCTLQAATRYFYWPNMSCFVSSCAACQAAKGSNRLPAGFVEPHVLSEDLVNVRLICLGCPGQLDGHNCPCFCALTRLRLPMPVCQWEMLSAGLACHRQYFPIGAHSFEQKCGVKSWIS